MRKENRDRNRDRDSGRDRNRDRDHDRDRDRDRRQRDRRRGDRDRSQPGGDSVTGTRSDLAPVQGPVVLLKRPDTGSSSTSTYSQSSGSSLQAGAATLATSKEVHDRGEHQKGGPHFSQVISKPTAILMRSGQFKKGDSFPDLRGTGTASSGATPSSDSQSGDVKLKPKPASQPAGLKQQYKFPQEHAIPLLNANKDMTVETDLEFVASNALCQDFFVVTAIGVPQAGKSSILSFLGSNEKFGGKKIFLPRKSSQQRECSVYMTSDKIILIEMPAVFNGNVTNDMISLMGPQGTLETAVISWNLRMMSWALSVSHIVLIVSEHIVDPNLLQLINSASMIHPTESVFGEGAFAELIYVCNKASSSLLEDMCTLKAAKAIFNSTLGKSSRISQNVFTIPHLQGNEQHTEFDNLKLRILDFIRYNRAVYAPEVKNIKKFPANITLAEWLQAVTRAWDDFGQPSGFQSYMKLLP